MKVMLGFLLGLLAIGWFLLGTYTFTQGDYGWASLMYLCFVINVVNVGMLASSD